MKKRKGKKQKKGKFTLKYERIGVKYVCSVESVQLSNLSSYTLTVGHITGSFTMVGPMCQYNITHN